jgi:hypothetical protein
MGRVLTSWSTVACSGAKCKSECLWTLGRKLKAESQKFKVETQESRKMSESGRAAYPRKHSESGATSKTCLDLTRRTEIVRASVQRGHWGKGIKNAWDPGARLKLRSAHTSENQISC